jgi:hypothetical protein
MEKNACSRHHTGTRRHTTDGMSNFTVANTDDTLKSENTTNMRSNMEEENIVPDIFTTQGNNL